MISLINQVFKLIYNLNQELRLLTFISLLIDRVHIYFKNFGPSFECKYKLFSELEGLRMVIGHWVLVRVAMMKLG